MPSSEWLLQYQGLVYFDPAEFCTLCVCSLCCPCTASLDSTIGDRLKNVITPNDVNTCSRSQHKHSRRHRAAGSGSSLSSARTDPAKKGPSVGVGWIVAAEGNRKRSVFVRARSDTVSYAMVILFIRPYLQRSAFNARRRTCCVSRKICAGCASLGDRWLPVHRRNDFVYLPCSSSVTLLHS